MGKKTYRFCNLRKRKDFNLKKKQFTLQKLCVTSLPWGPIYGRFMGCIVKGFFSVTVQTIKRP